jgi:TonB family protein
MTVPLLMFLAQVFGLPVPPGDSACVAATQRGIRASTDLCQAEAEMKAAAALPRDSSERDRRLATAVNHYERGIAGVIDPDLKKAALRQLSVAVGPGWLDRKDRLELVLREMLSVDPADIPLYFELARVQEDRGLIDHAEQTLLDTRHQFPDSVDACKQLAQFYVRRVTALQPPKPPQPSGDPSTLARDDQGVYRVGAELPPPSRIGVPKYPPPAQAAGIQGVVTAEIVVNESGEVADVKIVRSIPLLDDAALAAVRTWRYDPTLVDGHPVPVRMTVTVNFTTSR